MAAGTAADDFTEVAQRWSKVGELVSNLPPLKSLTADLYCAATGPLASALCVAGTLGSEDDSRNDGQFYRGVDMQQESHETVVWGEIVVDAQDWDVERLDLDRLPELSLYLLARYD